jgi:hypothetical protein
MSLKVDTTAVEHILVQGTIDLKGQDYTQVNARVLAFRLNNPQACIETVIVPVGDKFYVKAVISEDGTPYATAHKEIKFGVTGKSAAAMYPLETAETGAMGRALNVCGYGTLAGDLNEEDQISDAPVNKKPAKANVTTSAITDLIG